MKSIVSQLAYLMREREARRNLGALLRFLALLGALIGAFSVLFHVVMLHVEGQEHSWLTGLYWTLTVMSTLGFGDITFHTDLGRLFSIVVLLSGIVFLLILLPFAFIRYFYAPWLEAQIRTRAPRKLDADVRDHVLICKDDEIARGLWRRLELLDIPCYLLEPDPAKASALVGDGIPAVSGEVDSRETYAALGVGRARMVLVNMDDATNTNITLTIREEAPKLPVVAIVEDKDAVDILELSGATHVLALKHLLGGQLAGRVMAGAPTAQVVGRYKELLIAEFPVHKTALAGRTIRDTRLRELTGLNVVAYWERGKLLPAKPDAVLGDYAVAVVVGTESQVEELDAMMAIYKPNENPVIVIGGGKIGRACARALKGRGLTVHVVEENPELEEILETIADRVFIGDAADLRVVTAAGIAQAPSVVLTTNNDATNIYLAVYCRRLNPDAHIVSRITHERNLEAIHRAGADFVLSYCSLGVRLSLSLLLGRELVMLGEGVDLFVVDVPEELSGKTLAQSGIGAKTGLNVIAIQRNGGIQGTPGGQTVLDTESQLVVLGTSDQRRELERVFES